MKAAGLRPRRVPAANSQSLRVPMKTKYYVIAAIILVLDHLTKWWALDVLRPRGPLDIIPGYLSLSYVQNTGVAFGLFDGIESLWKPYILAALAVVAMGVIVLYGRHTPAHRKLLHLALAATSGGILGNFIDRIVRGYVVDFIEVHIQDIFYWPNFNVADSAISVGIALLVLDTVLNPEAAEAPEPPPLDMQS